MQVQSESDEEDTSIATTLEKDGYHEPKLVKILKLEKIYDDLYKPLSTNNITYGDLQFLQQAEIEEFCVAMDFNIKQKLKFRRLINSIQTNI